MKIMCSDSNTVVSDNVPKQEMAIYSDEIDMAGFNLLDEIISDESMENIPEMQDQLSEHQWKVQFMEYSLFPQEMKPWITQQKYNK